MWICMDCRETFSEPGTKSEDYGWETDLGHVSAYQYYYVCPNCGSADFDETEICAKCGETFAKDEMDYNIDGDLVCKDCFKAMNIYIDENDKGDINND